MNNRVSIEIKDHIAEVELSRPDKYNALDPDMFAAIAEAGESLRSNKDVRVVILHGAGKHFCSGLDISALDGLTDGNEGFQVDGFEKVYDSDSNKFQRVSTVWQDIEVPVIAALHGICFGGGAQIALGADMRYARADLQMSIMEIKWGLVPDMGITQSLRKLVRMDVAKELLYTGRIVDAAEALDIGLVTRVCEDPLAEARAMAAAIVGKNPDAIRRDKQLLEVSWDLPREDGLELEARLQGEIIYLENQVEAVMANFEKREPQFK